MELRDRAEDAIRRFHALGARLGGDPIIDYDCAPPAGDAEAYPHRLTALIRQYAAEYEPQVRAMTGSTTEFRLAVEDVETDAYWSYWLDGAGYDARLRINRSSIAFTDGDAYRFALHEVLGHALQYASITAYAERYDVPWPRLLAVHSNHQVLFEGLAQVLPLICRSDDPRTVAASRLDHYSQLVRGELHRAINTGESIADCHELVVRRAPYLKPEEVERELWDRSRSPRLRSYLWSYPAGLDWFSNLWERENSLLPEVLRAAYQQPIGPSELHALWPDGPAIGGDR
jgi:hypothetical protein